MWPLLMVYIFRRKGQVLNTWSGHARQITKAIRQVFKDKDILMRSGHVDMEYMGQHTLKDTNKWLG